MQNVESEGDITEAFGRRVREARTAYGLSQRALAERLSEVGIKLDPSAITRIELGSREVKLPEAVALSDILGIRLDHLTYDKFGPFHSRLLNLRTRILEARQAVVSAIGAVDMATEELNEEMVSELLEKQGGEVESDLYESSFSIVRLRNGGRDGSLAVYTTDMDREVKQKVIQVIIEDVLISEEQLDERMKYDLRMRARVLGLTVGEDDGADTK